MDDTYHSQVSDCSDDAVLYQPEAEQIALLAKAFAHPARVRIIAFLLSKPGCIGGDIVNQVGLAQSTVSEHLRILKAAGLVMGTIDYPRVCYALNPVALGPLQDIIAAVAAHPSGGDISDCYSPESCAPDEIAG